MQRRDGVAELPWPNLEAAKGRERERAQRLVQMRRDIIAKACESSQRGGGVGGGGRERRLAECRGEHGGRSIGPG